MTENMFCFQCEQTAKCEVCTGARGVCGKPLDVAIAQDELTGALIALARTCQAAGTVGEGTYELIENGLFACVTNVNFIEFVKAAPADTVVLTLACGKYRFNDLDLGQIGGPPRLMDVGQCNDAYSAIRIALALAEAFDCGVNDLPLSMVLSWYEQKAVCILLTLLHLGITNIKLGPTLPTFISPNVLGFLVDKFQIAPTTTPEADLAELLAQ